MKKLFPVLVLLLCGVSAHAQDTTYVLSLIDSCNEYLYSHADKALIFGHKALGASEKMGYAKGGSESLHKIGIVYDVTGEYDSSLYYFNALLGLGKRLNDSTIIATATNSRGLVLWNMGKPEQALPLFYEAYIIFERLKNPLGKGKSMNNISIILSDLGKLHDAIKAGKIAIENFRTAGVYERIGAPLTNIGLYYKDMKVYDSAAVFIKRSIEIKHSVNDDYGLGLSYSAFGALLDAQLRYDEALAYHTKALEYRTQTGDTYGVVESYYNLSKDYAKLGQNDKSFELISKAKPLAEELGSDRMLYKVYLELASHQSIRGNYKQALDYYIKYHEVRDSVTGNELHESMEDMRTKYETEATLRENLLLKEQNRVKDLQAQEASQREWIKTISLIFSVALFVLFVITAFLVYNRYKQKQELRLAEQVQQAEEKERGRIARDLHDNVGAHLAFIIQRLDHSSSAEKQQLSESATNALGTLRETVWALNKNNISVEDFADRLKTFIQTIQQGYVGFDIDFEEKVLINHRLSPGTALNLFRLCQEAISNAFRHSGGNRIHISIISNEAVQIDVKITDNGTGFDPEKDAKKDHYGLENMKHRAQEAGAEYTLHSQPGYGTHIEIVKKV